MVLESHPPHKIVNLLFEDLFDNSDLTICGGVDFRNPFNSYILL